MTRQVHTTPVIVSAAKQSVPAFSESFLPTPIGVTYFHPTTVVSPAAYPIGFPPHSTNSIRGVENPYFFSYTLDTYRYVYTVKFFCQRVAREKEGKV